MEYQVPQFIDVEDHIVGPLTLKQFIYLAGAGGITIIFFVYLPFFLAALLAIPFIGLGVALSFYKMNGKAFIEILEAGFNYYTGPKLFLWKHSAPTEKSREAAPPPVADTPSTGPRLSRGKLSELAWSLDVKKNVAPNERER